MTRPKRLVACHIYHIFGRDIIHARRVAKRWCRQSRRNCSSPRPTPFSPAPQIQQVSQARSGRAHKCARRRKGVIRQNTPAPAAAAAGARRFRAKMDRITPFDTTPIGIFPAVTPILAEATTYLVRNKTGMQCGDRHKSVWFGARLDNVLQRQRQCPCYP